jgi:hypothetical protein
MSSKHELTGVHDSDLPRFLADLGLWEDFEAGRITCAITGEVVTLDNLLSIYSDGQEIKFACNSPEARAHLEELNNL